MNHKAGPVKRRLQVDESRVPGATKSRGKTRGLLARLSPGSLGRLAGYDLPEADGEPLFAKGRKAAAKSRKSSRA